MDYKKTLFLGAILSFCGPLVAVQGTSFRAKVFGAEVVKIELHDANDACVGFARYNLWSRRLDALWIDPLYQKTSIGKFLAVCVVADIITRHPEVRVVGWEASSSGYMSDLGLIGYYERLGGVRQDGYSRWFKLDLDVIRKQNTLFDFKKISDRIRSGATFSFDMSKKEEEPKIDGDGNPILRSRL